MLQNPTVFALIIVYFSKVSLKSPNHKKYLSKVFNIFGSLGKMIVVSLMVVVVVRTLRENLQIEWNVNKDGKLRDVSGYVMNLWMKILFASTVYYSKSRADDVSAKVNTKAFISIEFHDWKSEREQIKKQ